MTGKKISQLPPVASPALTDIIAAVQTGITGQETLQQLFTLFVNNINGSTIPSLTVTTLTTTTLTATNITASSLTFSPSTGGIVGTTTNDNAGAGKVGEFFLSTVLQADAVPLTTNTPANVTSIPLTAGDWDVYGNCLIISSGQFLNVGNVWTSIVSATRPDGAGYNSWNGGSVLPQQIGQNTPFLRVSIAAPTTVYLSAECIFGSGTASACGQIMARRPR